MSAMLRQAVVQIEIPGLRKLASGKVREIFDLGDNLLFVATDRVSAFDVVMGQGIPDKGRVLNQLSAFWFEKLADLCSHHLVSIDDEAIARALGRSIPELGGRSAIVKRAKTIPIECVARGYIAGSLYKEYQQGGGDTHGLDLPNGLLDGSRLPEPIFTPATKAESGHDQNISFREVVDRVGKETAMFLRDATLAIYAEATKHAESCGYILADTKLEFGTTDNGILWIDEALTPDSSRYWEIDRWCPGGPQPSSDKQFLRDYLESSGWDKRPPPPTLPAEILQTTRQKYIEAYRRLTARELAE